MTKEELVVLLENTLREMPDCVDGIHAAKQLLSALSSSNYSVPLSLDRSKSFLSQL